jgi:signal transduction histidine kinase
MSVAQPIDYAVQPFQGTDVLAWVMAVSAVLCLVIRWRDGDKGMGWFGFSMGGLALWMAFNTAHLPTGSELNPSPWYYVMCAAMAAMAPGLVAYLRVPPPWSHWLQAGILMPSAIFAALVAWVSWSGAVIPRAPVHGLTALAFAAMGSAACWAGWRDPLAGHHWLGLALLTVPLLAVGLIISGTDPVAMRYWAVLPASLVGLVMPSVSLLRSRRAAQAELARRREAEAALARLNSELERTVATRTEDLERMVSALESFNRSVSHDLRGPLGGMAGLARLADEALAAGDDSVARRALPLIAQQADASTRLVASLLSLAHVADAPLQRTSLDPTPLVRDIIEQQRAAHPGPLPEFVVRELPTVNADPTLLRAVLTNLIGNAVKFTRDREHGLIEVASVQREEGVCLQVRDNGVGFDNAQAAAMFKPFKRLHEGRFEGHGIGLSIVRRAVERHGGQVRAEGCPGQGASFQFNLPQAA